MCGWQWVFVAANVLDSMLKELMGIVVAEAKELSMMNNRATLTSREVQTAVRLNLPGEVAKHAVAEGTKAVTKFSMNSGGPLSKRAGLQFPVSFCHNELKKRSGLRVGKGGSVYLAAVLEYTCAEVLELAGNASRDDHKRRIIPRHILLAVRSDEELTRLFKGTIPFAGVVPGFQPSLVHH